MTEIALPLWLFATGCGVIGFVIGFMVGGLCVVSGQKTPPTP